MLTYATNFWDTTLGFPHECGDRPGRQRCGRTLAPKRNAHLPARCAPIEHIENHAPVWVAKSHILDVRSGRLVRSHANRAGKHELARVSQHVVVKFGLEG